jgi:hypothetical protein
MGGWGSGIEIAITSMLEMISCLSIKKPNSRDHVWGCNLWEFIAVALVEWKVHVLKMRE